MSLAKELLLEGRGYTAWPPPGCPVPFAVPANALNCIPMITM